MFQRLNVDTYMKYVYETYHNFLVKLLVNVVQQSSEF